jgi:hypothetical protein
MPGSSNLKQLRKEIYSKDSLPCLKRAPHEKNPESKKNLGRRP